MIGPFELYLALLATGLFLIGAEIYLPGGVVGFIGVLALLGAMVMGFSAFGLQGGLASATVIIVLAGVMVFVWVRYFPRTGMGHRLTLMSAQTGMDYKAPPDDAGLAGKEGVAQSELRPSGIALVEGRRLDVIADGEFIPAKAPIRIVRIEGVRILVRTVELEKPLEGTQA